MLGFLIASIFLLAFKLFLAGKDASSYLLRDKNPSDIALAEERIFRWHRDGVILDLLNTFGIAYIFGDDWWQIIFISVLLRLSVFDLAFNFWAGLSVTYLGSTAYFDRLFIKVFGKNGAVKKSISFFCVLLVFFFLKSAFKF